MEFYEGEEEMVAAPNSDNADYCRSIDSSGAKFCVIAVYLRAVLIDNL